MPDRPSFPIPENKTPETYCLQIQMPNDPIWKTVIAGLLFQPAEWFNWQRDEDKSGKVLAQYWRKIYNEIDWSDMSCCCTDKNQSPSGFYRVNSSGQMETSSDGGVTWTVNTTQDYRYNSGQFPPIPVDVLGDDAQCQSANNVLAYLQHSESKYNDAWSLSGDIGALVAAVLALINELGLLTGFTALTIAAAGFPYLLVLGVVVAVYYFGRSAWHSSFTDDFWSKVLCIIFNNIGADGTITTSAFELILSQINALSFSAARLYIWAVVNAMGVVGLQNAARTMSSSVESCDSCEDFCGMTWAWPTDALGTAGTITVDGATKTVTIEAMLLGGSYYAGYNGVSDCCNLGAEIHFTTTGVKQFFAGWTCGTPIETANWYDESNVNWNPSGFNTMSPGNFTAIIARCDSPFTLELIFTT